MKWTNSWAYRAREFRMARLRQGGIRPFGDQIQIRRLRSNAIHIIPTRQTGIGITTGTWMPPKTRINGSCPVTRFLVWGVAEAIKL